MAYKQVSVCIKVILSSIFVLFFQVGFSQASWTGLEDQLKVDQKALGTDLVMMVWKRGDTLQFKKELGTFNSKTDAPLGAASTWLTAALVMQFIDEGKLSLDDKVNKWLPEFEKYNKNYVTIRYCLAHMTGIKDETNFLRPSFRKANIHHLKKR